ncbi:MAG: hypothetical protein ACRD1W_15705, partial [Vicinamibacterales bacterium]
DLSPTDGFFKFGDAIGFGRLAGALPAAYANDSLTDASGYVQMADGRPVLPFDLAEVATNLREERYRLNGYNFLQKSTTGSAVQRLYYQFRPLLGVGVRKHLQKVRLSGWDKIPFPRWPVDRSVDVLMESAMALALKANGQASIPFIWFWPEGAQACGMMTHDVEGQEGVDYCDALMDIDDSYGVKSAFQLIPEGREEQWRQTAGRLRPRGFEVNLHDLNHDGRLFADKEAFFRHARRINDYAREFGCEGFRSGAMYREQSWFGAFKFSYDMSVPNAAHLEPQRGGCCTVMPYFVGNILELPLTTVQDYTLFHILNDYSTTLWKEQIRLIRERHGLISVITHPDYLVGQRERGVYIELLRHLAELRERQGLWIALPGEINRWWRSRQQMTLTATKGGWRIDGPDSHRARVAYASLGGDRLVYTVDGAGNGARETSAAPA